MKKTIIIIILAVYVGSIALVNFLGIATKQPSKTTYVKSIQCDTITSLGEGGKELYPQQKLGNVDLFVFGFIPAPEDDPYTIENLDTNPNKIQLNYHVFPELSDDDTVEFEYDEESGVVVYNELSKTFIVLKPQKIFTVTIVNRLSNVRTTVKIRGIVPNE